MNITRGQAACMFFQQEHNETNEIELLQKIDSIDVDLCYEKDPAEPISQYIPKIYGNPFRYHRYITTTSEQVRPPQESSNDAQIIVTTNEKRLGSISQVVHYLNEVFLSYNPYNDEVYEYRECTLDMIIEVARRHTTIFDDKNLIGFSKWCSAKNIHFMSVNQKRKGDDFSRSRSLYVLKEKFMGKLCLVFIRNIFELILYISKYC
ncbi:hypothetical protein BDC45DRAFT_445834 [Circinella umbellata]|nr:hypothetical protein BDC45DRAFT_445834 [Circinella umbellata]